ncbi:MAG TPA: DUF2799 domain-containing protein [Woeseiaceae bacterium]|nr:DUF2799 domain-containing protein [Woeseiaceae bacterium]
MRIAYCRALMCLALAGLGGCATMSAEECALSDWHTVGFEDGSRGFTADRLGDHRRACAEHGYAPDFAAYQAGREDGLRLYCQPARGFNVGSNGGRYLGVCPPDLEAEFLDGYQTGVELYNLRSNVNSANSRISASQNELQRTKDLMRTKEAALIDRDTATEERILLLADLKELAERSGELEGEIDRLIDERARHEERLAAYQATLAHSGY